MSHFHFLNSYYNISLRLNCSVYNLSLSVNFITSVRVAHPADFSRVSEDIHFQSKNVTVNHKPCQKNVKFRVIHNLKAD